MAKLKKCKICKKNVKPKKGPGRPRLVHTRCKSKKTPVRKKKATKKKTTKKAPKKKTTKRKGPLPAGWKKSIKLSRGNFKLIGGTESKAVYKWTCTTHGSPCCGLTNTVRISKGAWICGCGCGATTKSKKTDYQFKKHVLRCMGLAQAHNFKPIVTVIKKHKYGCKCRYCKAGSRRRRRNPSKNLYIRPTKNVFKKFKIRKTRRT